VSRPPRRLPLGSPVHVVNRGNEKRTLFFEKPDYWAFLDRLAEAKERFPVDIDGFALMPNHVHLIVRQAEPGAVSAYMHRVSTLSAMRFRSKTGTVGLGHVFQRRFWARPILDTDYYLRALRYIESNALRAELVMRAEHWEWGSLWERVTKGRRLLSAPLVRLPDDWVDLVNVALSPDELEELRHPVKIGRPRRVA
jgi:putative transposase